MNISRSMTRAKAFTDPTWAYDRIFELEAEAEHLRLALIAIRNYARAPHNRMGEACGEDACIGCLIEATALEALQAGMPGGRP